MWGGSRLDRATEQRVDHCFAKHNARVKVLSPPCHPPGVMFSVSAPRPYDVRRATDGETFTIPTVPKARRGEASSAPQRGPLPPPSALPCYWAQHVCGTARNSPIALVLETCCMGRGSSRLEDNIQTSGWAKTWWISAEELTVIRCRLGISVSRIALILRAPGPQPLWPPGRCACDNVSALL